MKQLLRVLLVIYVLIGVTFPPISEAKTDPIIGVWRVATKLVSAYDPTNPAYQPGQRREETWKVQVLKKPRGQVKLTTWAGWRNRQLIGSINGKKVGKAWKFQGTYNTGLGIVIRQYIVARVQTNGKLKGTIETGYYSAQFGYILGKDALSFSGTKNR